MIVLTDTTTTLDWADLKSRTLELESQGFAWGAQHHAMQGFRNERWAGQTGAQTAEYLREGFKSPLFTAPTVTATPRRRKRARWSEDEGDADAGRLLGGCDDFYLTRGHVDSRPGLTLEIVDCFSSSVQASTVAEYGAWVASLIGSLEADGYDLEVAITIPTRGNTFQEAERQAHTTRMIVKRPGEVSDFASWSVLFSPGGFRHLGFIAIGMAAEARKLTCTSGMGQPSSNGWGVSKDADDPSRILISCNPAGGPMKDKLNREARAAGLIH